LSSQTVFGLLLLLLNFVQIPLMAPLSSHLFVGHCILATCAVFSVHYDGAITVFRQLYVNFIGFRLSFRLSIAIEMGISPLQLVFLVQNRQSIP